MQTSLFLLTAALSLTGPPARQAAAPGRITLEGCLVSPVLNGEIDISAEEPGKLSAMELREGLQVEAGTLLVKIDDTVLQAQREERQYEMAIAELQAKNDVNVRFAEASYKVAEAELHHAMEVNRKASGAITQSEIRRLTLTLEKTRLQKEQALMEQEVSVNTAGAKAARLKELNALISHREIRAPNNGEMIVVEVFKDLGEWVNPGDTILKLMRLDLLRVEGHVNAAELNHEQVDHKPVTVRVKMANNRVEEFTGKIVYAEPRLQLDGRYRVYAEVVNRRNPAKTHWLLSPGAVAEMSIDLRGGLAGEPPADRNAQLPAHR